MKICIVGNGSSVLKNKNGRFINSCDCVVRLKQFKISGYEHHVGDKTDIYASKWFSWFENKPPYAPKNMNHVKHASKFWFTFCDPVSCTVDHDNVYLERYIQYGLKNNTPEKNGDIKKHNEYIKLFSLEHANINYISTRTIVKLAEQLSLSDQLIYDKMSNPGVKEPSTGMCAIMMALDTYPNDQIYITGFDSFLNSSWYWDDSHRINPTCHDYLKERLLITRLIHKKYIINIDDGML